MSTEKSKVDPWTLIAKHKLEAEKYLATVPGYVVSMASLFVYLNLLFVNNNTLLLYSICY